MKRIEEWNDEDRTLWARMKKLAPELLRLELRAQETGDPGGKSFCAQLTFMDRFKPRVSELVGWRRKDEDLLSTSQAYDLAYEAISDGLPPCRYCACVGSYDLAVAPARPFSQGMVVVGDCPYCRGRHYHEEGWGLVEAHCVTKHPENQGYVLVPAAEQGRWNMTKLGFEVFEAAQRTYRSAQR